MDQHHWKTSATIVTPTSLQAPKVRGNPFFLFVHFRMRIAASLTLLAMTRGFGVRCHPAWAQRIEGFVSLVAWSATRCVAWKDYGLPHRRNHGIFGGWDKDGTTNAKKCGIMVLFKTRQAGAACLVFVSIFFNSYLIMYKAKNPLFFPQEYDKI